MSKSSTLFVGGASGGAAAGFGVGAAALLAFAIATLVALTGLGVLATDSLVAGVFAVWTSERALAKTSMTAPMFGTGGVGGAALASLLRAIE